MMQSVERQRDNNKRQHKHVIMTNIKKRSIASYEIIIGNIHETKINTNQSKIGSWIITWSL